MQALALTHIFYANNFIDHKLATLKIEQITLFATN